MGKSAVKVIRRLILILLIVLTIVYLVYLYSSISISTIGTSKIVPQYVKPTYSVIDDNIIVTNINGISNVIVNMQKDAYDVYSEDITDQYIDISFTKQNYPTYRYYYEKSSGKLTFISAPYENSNTGLAYIIENK